MRMRHSSVARLLAGATIHGKDVAFFFLLLHCDSGKVNSEFCVGGEPLLQLHGSQCDEFFCWFLL